MRPTFTHPRRSERPPSFEQATVADVMHPGVLSCPPDVDMRAVAAIMATNRVHSVLVSGIEELPGRGHHLGWGVVSDVDLVAAARADSLEERAVAFAATEVVTVGENEPLTAAAELMVEHDLTHLLVVGSKGLPVGVVSTLDLAGAIAGGEA